MKVYIGPYKSWIGPYQIVDKIFFWIDRRGIFPDDDPRHERWDYKAHDKLGDWLADTWVSDFCNWFHDRKPRKINIRIDQYDTWSMDHTLSLIAHPMLVQLKAAKHGSPFVDDEDVPEELRSTSAPALTDEQKNYGETDANFHKRWEWVMDEMIFAHHSKLNEWEDEYHDRQDYDGIREVEKRIGNGFRLFGKYYNGLWD